MMYLILLKIHLKAGQYKNDVQAVKVLTKESIENVDSLVALGIRC